MNLGAFLGIVFVGFAVWLTQGRLSPAAAPNGEIGILLLSAFLIFAPYLGRKKITQSTLLNLGYALLLLIPVVTSMVDDNLLYTDLANQNKGLRFLGPLQITPFNGEFLLHACLGVSAVFLLILFGMTWFSVKKIYPALLTCGLLGLTSLCLVLIAVPFPWIDVFTSNTTATVRLLEGVNPYATNYLDLYGGQAGYQPSFGYLPGYFVAGIPAVLLGDVRFASIFFIGVPLFWLLHQPVRGQASGAASVALTSCLLYGGSSLYIIEQAWIDPVLAGLLFLGGALVRKQDFKAAGAILGLAIAFKQYAFLGVVPLALFVISTRGIKGAMPMVSAILVTAFFIIIPFMVWGIEDFFRATVFGIQSLPVRPDALSLRALLISQTGQDQAWLGWLGPLSFLMLLIWRHGWKISSLADAYFVAALFYLAVFLFSSHSFANYYYLVFLLFLFSVMFTDSREEGCPDGVFGKKHPVVSGRS